MEINWGNYVDHIYCVSFTQNAKTRIPLLYNELEFIDIHKNDEIFSIYYNKRAKIIEDNIIKLIRSMSLLKTFSAHSTAL